MRIECQGRGIGERRRAFEGRGGMWVSSRQFGAIVEALAGGFERVATRRRMWAVFLVPICGGIFLRARVRGLPPYIFFNLIKF